MKVYHLEKSLTQGKYPIYFEGNQDGGGKFWIELMQDYDWPKVNSLMEMCSGPGFMGYYLKHKYNIKTLSLVDNHKPLKSVIKKTNKDNNWDDEVTFYLSNGVDDYNGDKVDMIVCNPPHIPSKDEFIKFNKKITTSTPRIVLDDELKLHKNLLENLDKVLTPNGYLMLFESGDYISTDLILSMNPRLNMVDFIDHHTDYQLYSALFQFI